MSDTIYHRKASIDEMQKVRATKFLWGKAPRQVAGNGPPCVKAFLGRLPSGEAGYNFRAKAQPSHYPNFFGEKGAISDDRSPGVETVPEDKTYVRIAVEVLND
jgi:hypothetical protein